MLGELFEHVLTYDPKTIDPEIRESMGRIIQARADYLAASAQVAAMRAKIWAGDTNLSALADIQADDLTKARLDYAMQVRNLVKEAIDLDSLMELVPMIIAGLLQSVKVPFPVLFEAVGVDLDQVKLAAEALRDMFEEL